MPCLSFFNLLWRKSLGWHAQSSAWPATNIVKLRRGLRTRRIRVCSTHRCSKVLSSIISESLQRRSKIPTFRYMIGELKNRCNAIKVNVFIDVRTLWTHWTERSHRPMQGIAQKLSIWAKLETHLWWQMIRKDWGVGTQSYVRPNR